MCVVCVCLEELLVPAVPEKADIERGYVTPQQVYNLLNAEAGEPALHDPYYILILDCRSADRYHMLHPFSTHKYLLKYPSSTYVPNLF